MSDIDKTRKIAMIGLGNMGSALAEALLSAGYPVVVWNRTISKSEPLVEQGATVANSPAEAAQEAQITVVCVAEHAVIVELIQNDAVAKGLEGKLLAQLGVVTAEQARQTTNWAKERNIGYLEGSILGLPAHVKTATATLVCSGPRDVFDTHKDLLAVFGNPQHVSETVGAAYDFDKVYYSLPYSMFLGFIQGAALAHASGFSIEAFINIALERIPNITPQLKNFGDLISNRNYDSDQATLHAWAAAYSKSLDLCRTLRVDETLPSALMHNLQKAIDAGYGDKEMSAVFEVLLPRSS